MFSFACTSTSGLFRECKFLEFMFFTYKCRHVKFGSFKRKQLQSNTYKLEKDYDL